jgi:hypothetical protein
MSDNEHLERVRAMSKDNGQTWDLSANDQTALMHVLDLLESMADYIADTNGMLPVEVFLHFSKSVQERKS